MRISEHCPMVLRRLFSYLPSGMTGYTLCALIALGIWASFFELDVMVRGSGIIRVESRNLTLQHPEGGVVTRLLVHEGDMIRQGQLIAIIDNSIVSESSAKNQIERKALLIKVDRLKHELSGENYQPELTDEESIDAILLSERELYLSRQISLRAQQQVNQAQLEQRKMQIAEYTIKLSDLSEQLSIAQKQVQLYSTMVKSGAAAEGALLQKQFELQQVQTTLNEFRLRLPKVKSEMNEYQARYDQIASDFKSDVQKQLTQLYTDLSRVDVEGVASQNRRQNARIVSPVDGVVQRLFVVHEGAVIRSGGEVVEIAPSKVPLVAEVKIRPEDRDRIWENMSARIHISAFNSSYANTLEGRVAIISADAITNEQNNRYYLVSIEVPAGQLTNPIYPGMGVDAYLQTGKRTPLQYLLKPLLNNAPLIFSEP